jgi:hypothetical protein
MCPTVGDRAIVARFIEAGWYCKACEFPVVAYETSKKVVASSTKRTPSSKPQKKTTQKSTAKKNTQNSQTARLERPHRPVANRRYKSRGEGQ